MQSAKSMDVICKIFSVFETAKRCGVADPARMARPLSHYQYAHWIEARAQHDLDTGAGKDFNKAYADWDLAESRTARHIDQFLPWNCSNGVPGMAQAQSARHAVRDLTRADIRVNEGALARPPSVLGVRTNFSHPPVLGHVLRCCPDQEGFKPFGSSNFKPKDE